MGTAQPAVDAAQRGMTARTHGLSPNRRRWAALATSLAILLCLPLSAVASEPEATDLSPGALEAFIDELMADHLDRFGFAGATVTVVNDGEMVVSKGYGHADIAAGVAVDAETTLFPTASVAKLFTWTAVMQLVEAGQLDLDAEVNSYLSGFQIPDTFGEPVRVSHLLSHTAGFEDRPVASLLARTAGEVPDLEAALIRFMPARDWEPGLYTAYSNYGPALAAHLVAEVSGMSWEEYLERRVLQPLGMTHTSPRQPVPEALAPHTTKVYTAGENGLDESFFEFSMMAPAGGIVATGHDMGRFLLAHLQGGRLGDERILDEATVQQMHSQLFTHDARLPGNAHGFWEHEERGQRILSHAGDLNTSHALLALAPEHDLGFYVAYNSVGGPEAREAFSDAFWDHAFGAETPAAEPAAGTYGPVERFAGSYANNRMATTTMTRLLAAISVMTISVADDGVLVTEVAGFVEPERWVQVGVNEFAQVDGPARMVFGEADGSITHVVFGGSKLTAYAPLSAFLPATWIDGPALHAGVLLSAVLLMLSALVLWPMIALVQRRRPRDGTGMRRLARWWAAATAGLYLLFMVLLVIMVADFSLVEYGFSPFLIVTLSLGVAAAVMTLGVVILAVLAWRHGHWRLATRLHYTFVALAFVALAWQLNHWNLLGFRV